MMIGETRGDTKRGDFNADSGSGGSLIVGEDIDQINS